MLKKICSWLLAAATAAAVFLPQVTIYAAQTTVISVADYGADPSGKTDSTKAVADAIAAAAEIDGAATVVFPTGRYDFYPETSAVRELYISNTVGADQNYKNKKIGILIEDADNITIDGQGSTFIYHGKMSEFAIINSTNITLKNFTADFEVPTVVDVTVESIEGNTAIAYIPEAYNYTVSGKTITWSSDVSPYTGEVYWTGTNSMNYTQIYDTVQGRTWRGTNYLFQNVSSIEDLGNNRVKFTYSSINSAMKEGYCFQMRPTVRDHAGGFIWKSKDTVIQNVNFQFLHGFGIVGQHSENITFDTVNFETDKSTGRTTAGYADFLQMSGCKGLISITNCVFSNPHDDPINIHGTFNTVTEIIAPNKIKVTYVHNETAGFPNYFVGDQIEFMTKGDMTVVSDSIRTVTAIDGPDGQGGNMGEGSSLTTIILTLDQDIPAEITANSTHVVENITYTPEVYIANNVFKETPTRGILCTTRKKTVIENNVFDGMGMASIYISNDAQGWYESGPVRDMTISNNVFTRMQAQAIYIEPTNPTVNSNKTVHSNITITENTFYADGRRILDAKSVENMLFANNTIYVESPLTSAELSDSNITLMEGSSYSLQSTVAAKTLSTAIYSFNGCKNVMISKNIYENGVNTGSSLSNMSADEVIVSDDAAAVGTGNQLSNTAKTIWKSSDTSVAAVSSDGTVTARKEGTAQIIATVLAGSRSYELSKVTVTVSAKEAESSETVAIGQPVYKTDVNTALEVEAEVLNENGESVEKELTWTVKNLQKTAGANIHNCIFTASEPGIYLIKAATEEGNSASAIVSVSKAGYALSEDWSIASATNDGADVEILENGITITTQPRGLYQEQAGSNIVTGAILSEEEKAGEIEVTVKMSGLNTAKSWGSAGLYFLVDEDNYISIERKERGSGTYKMGVVREVSRSASESYQNGSESAAPDINADSIYLKLKKYDENGSAKVKAWYSLDNETWIEVATVDAAFLGNNWNIAFASCESGSNPKVSFENLTVNGKEISFTSPVEAEAVESLAISENNGVLSTNAPESDAVFWFVSESENGSFSAIDTTSRELNLDLTLAGKFIKAAAIHKNSTVYSDAVFSEVYAAGESGAAAITFENSSISAKVNEEVQLNAKAVDVFGNVLEEELDWSVFNLKDGLPAENASVTEEGIFSAATSGVYLAKAFTVNGTSAAALLTVTETAYQANDSWSVLNQTSASDLSWMENSVAITAKPTGQYQEQSPSNVLIGDVLTDEQKAAETLTVTVKMTGKTSAGKWGSAGLYLYDDQDNYISIERKERGSNGSKIAVVREADRKAGETWENGSEGNAINQTGSAVWLKLVKTGSSITGSYSTDGSTWIDLSAVDGAFLSNDLKIALAACESNSSDPVVTFSELTVNGESVSITRQLENTPADKAVISKTDEGLLSSAGNSDLTAWFVSDTREGAYTCMAQASGTLMLTEELAGKFVKAAVLKGNGTVYAEPVFSEPYEITDASFEQTVRENANANLGAAEVSGFENPLASQYQLSLAGADDRIMLYSFVPEIESTNVEVSFNGIKQEGSFGRVNLTGGINVLEVKTTAEDSSSFKTYRYVVLRHGDTDNTLQSLAISNQNVEFDEEGNAIVIIEPDTALKIEAVPAAESSAIEIFKDNVRLEADTVGAQNAQGEIVVKVTPESGNVKWYTVLVRVKDPADATILSITAPKAVINTPAFDMDVKDYSGEITTADQTMSIKALFENTKLRVSHNGKEIASGTGSLQVNLPAYLGSNIYTVTAISADESTVNTYTYSLEGKEFVYLSDLPWVSQTTGYAENPTTKDLSSSGNPITLFDGENEVVYEKGIGSHAPSTIVYDLSGYGFTNLAGFAGVDREVHPNSYGHITFKISLDGKEEANSGVINAASTQYGFDLDIAGKSQLVLTMDQGDNNWSDHGDWADMKLSTSLEKAPVDKTTLQNTLNSANALIEDGTADTKGEEAKDAFEKAISKARAVLENENAGQEEIDAANMELLAAIQALLDAEIPAEPLSKVILEWLVAAVESADLDLYMNAGKAELQTELENAKKVLEEAKTQDEIVEATLSLNAAWMNMRFIPDENLVKRLIDTANTDFDALDLSQEQKEATSAFRARVSALQDVDPADYDLEIYSAAVASLPEVEEIIRNAKPLETDPEESDKEETDKPETPEESDKEETDKPETDTPEESDKPETDMPEEPDSDKKETDKPETEKPEEKPGETEESDKADKDETVKPEDSADKTESDKKPETEDKTETSKPESENKDKTETGTSAGTKTETSKTANTAKTGFESRASLYVAAAAASAGTALFVWKKKSRKK